MNDRLVHHLTTAGAAPKTVAASAVSGDDILRVLAHWQPLTALLPPLLVFASAIIAWTAIRKNQDVNRRRATIDLIEKSESSEHYQKITITFRQQFAADRTPQERERLHDPKSDEERDTRRHIQQFLNHYELVAVGILGGSLHETTYRVWMMTVVIRDWNRAADYIQRERWKYDPDRGWTYSPLPYEAFERLAAGWARRCRLKVTKISERYSKPPAEPAGPGDEAVPSLVSPSSGGQPVRS